MYTVVVWQLKLGPPQRELLLMMVKPNEVSRLEDEVRHDEETEEDCLFCNETTLRTVSKQKLAPQALKNEFQVLQVRVFWRSIRLRQE